MKEDSSKHLQAILEENKSALRISKLEFQQDLGDSHLSQNRLSMHDLNYQIESSNPNQSSNINFAVTKSKLNDLRAKKKLDEELRLTTLAESMVFEDFVNTSSENPKFQQGPETKKYYQQKTMAHLQPATREQIHSCIRSLPTFLRLKNSDYNEMYLTVFKKNGLLGSLHMLSIEDFANLIFRRTLS